MALRFDEIQAINIENFSGTTILEVTQPTYTILRNPEGSRTLYMGDSGDRVNYYDNNSHRFRYAGGSSTQMIINASGNVGIGTTSPSYGLDIGINPGSGNVATRLTQGTYKVRINGIDLLGYSTDRLWMLSDNTNSSLVVATSWDWDKSCEFFYTPGTSGAGGGVLTIGQITKNNTNWTHGHTRFKVGGSDAVSITTTGLGIGTNAPSNKLTINNNYAYETGSTHNNPHIKIQEDSGSTYISGIQHNMYISTSPPKGASRAYLADGATKSVTAYLNGNTLGDFRIYTGSGTTNTIIQETPKLILTNSGNLGVGTLAPAAKFSVAQPTSGYTTVLLGRRAGQSSIKSDTTEGGYLILDSAANAVALNHYSNNNVWLVTGGGNVGVGTTSPSAKLDIHTATNSNGLLIREDTDDSITHNFYVDSSDNGQALLYANGQVAKISLNTAGSSYFNGGNVGIGTTSPNVGSYNANNSILTLKGKAAAYGGIVEFQNAGTSGNNQSLGYFSFLDNTTKNAVIEVARESSTSTAFISFQTNNGTSLEDRMRITSGGNVGVGTTSPSDGDLNINDPKLHVVGPSTASAFNLVARFQGGSDSDNTGAAIAINHSNDRGLLIRAGRKDSDRPVAYFDLIDSNGSRTNMMTLGEFGTNFRVDIDPFNQLNASSPSPVPNSIARVGGSLTIQAGKYITLDDDYYNHAHMRYNGSGGEARFELLGYYGIDFKTRSTTKMVIKGDTGFVGIGTTSPSSKLDVDGKITLSGDSEHYIEKSTTSLIKSNQTDTTVISGRTLDLYAYDDVNIRAGSTDKITFTSGGVTDGMIIKGSHVHFSQGVQVITTTSGTINLNAASYGVFRLTSSLTGTTTLNLQNMRSGQVIDVILTGDQTVNLQSDDTSETFYRVGDTTYDGTATNHLQIVCVDSTSSAALYHFTVSKIASSSTI